MAAHTAQARCRPAASRLESWSAPCTTPDTSSEACTLSSIVGCMGSQVVEALKQQPPPFLPCEFGGLDGMAGDQYSKAAASQVPPEAAVMQRDKT